ncbi:hypothetical protein Poli38472_010253 [Pythium oligandrum]|uniref:SET domain-containing protein n=1 Tax=Pythium oligandrum TaxID=41045 RepID=A0A8K1FF70_PYTOL|nr:hypothetical protein Poli38472_010253 [Pythium oligandrum]|eukprot:TMW58694.1 hypothetical protein Poli38472_010253 [Pythium oligandrum]
MATPAEERFVQWLLDNGASFPKLEWPVLTENGLRGAIAREEIHPNEAMLTIPQRLMISEATCWADPQLRRVYEENRDVFARDDPVIALFLVREKLKGEESFYHPYLAILPEVINVQDWSKEELEELRDSSLAEAAARRSTEVQTFYDGIMELLDEKYPGEFPRNQYTFDRFRFAWKSIQARTFGRRLPWTSLVPFADCLNHSNVATKYDFDVDGNGSFRLFPSASNSYAKGAEVFNSYGRRPNFQLLLDYGFALEDNEWEYVEVSLPRDTSQILGSRFPFKKRIRLDRMARLNALFPRHLFPAFPPEKEESGKPTHQNLPRRDVLNWFRSVLLNAQSEFKMNREDDERHLRDALSERMHLALIYRLGRMKVLEGWIAQTEQELTEVEDSVDSTLSPVASKLRSIRFEDKS